MPSGLGSQGAIISPGIAIVISPRLTRALGEAGSSGGCKAVQKAAPADKGALRYGRFI